MLTFYHSPQSCSNGILLLLHEVGAAFETRIIDLRAGDQRRAEYLAQNTKGKVPALGLPDGSVLTEFPAIAMWLADSFPEAGLAPESAIKRARISEMLDYIVGSVHMRGFTFDKMPQKFLSDPAGQATLRAHGRAEVAKGLGFLSNALGHSAFLLGDFSAADAALFYVLDWAEQDGGYDLPANLERCLARIRARPACLAAAPILRRPQG
ncbi:glutathione S-transferase family protein [Sulfitobacter sp. PR48]|uniref:glutathione S-transferase family protein n=1 Tax=Sulfitobacter sp. PR48 TaxID=3028383 RepID=UPI00237A2F76|nr:glutathione S-transferase family protein [Sulfitobacter sp. PR48]MDD9721062.1 glutathione S-transferase family protein [Sulfitobacter sp. PR48]